MQYGYCHGNNRVEPIFKMKMATRRFALKDQTLVEKRKENAKKTRTLQNTTRTWLNVYDKNGTRHWEVFCVQSSVMALEKFG